MQDRVPLYPGRVQLTPVSGNLYDMSMADQPQVQGTPLDKATFLKDATAALYGLPNTAVPDDVFAMLPGMINSKAKIATGTYTGTGTYGLDNPTSITLPFKPKFVWIFGARKSGTKYDQGNQTYNAVFNPTFLSDVTSGARSGWGGYGYANLSSGTQTGVNNFARYNDSTNKLEWAGASAGHQMNLSNFEYCWVAIG